MLRRLVEALSIVHHDIRRLDPRLEIYYPDVASALEIALNARSRLVAELNQMKPMKPIAGLEQVKDELETLREWDSENIPTEFDELIRHADRSAREVDSAIEALRSLLAREFRFKDDL
jgi:hypothetical protein